VKQYFTVLRTLALLAAVLLTLPSVAPLACDWMCGRQHDAAVPVAGSCHDAGGPRSTLPALAGGHVCHDIGALPTSIVRDASQLALPAIARAVDGQADFPTRQVLLPAPARLTAHAPPPLALPLRI
jgi:hypothetical protein